MANEVEFEDNSVAVKNAMETAINAWLHDVGGELASQAKRNMRVDHGQLKGSWKCKVYDDKVIVGSTSKNAIWEEFGTGQFALNGDGRQTPWYVPVEDYMGTKKPTYNGKVIIVYGKSGKAFYKTNGKKPQRGFWKAFTKLKPKIIKSLENKLKGTMK